MKLTSMTDFVLEQWEENDSSYDFVKKSINYAKFLKQPLTLGMFVPCDLECNVLEEPSWWSRYNSGASPFMNMDEIRPCQDYEEAKERCLFEGFKFDKETATVYKGIGLVVYMLGESKTVEDLVKYDLQLTPTALKQLGL